MKENFICFTKNKKITVGKLSKLLRLQAFNDNDAKFVNYSSFFFISFVNLPI